MSRYASLSVDLDNHWSYLKTHGNPAWEGFPSYLDRVVPLVCDFAEDLGIRLTMFVVGQDAELGKNADSMALIGASGHEVANHSFHHEPWLHLKSHAEIEEEIGRAHRAIEQATGKASTGFRGPGFSISQDTMHVLDTHGYSYDASTLPTFIGPLARAFYMRSSGLDDDELEQRSQLFGGVKEVLRSNRPYLWRLSEGDQGPVEVPVTTMPLLRVPIHATYLLYIAKYSPALSRAYLKTALGLCRLTGTMPSILLHSLDFIGAEDITDLGFFPGMDMSGQVKRSLLRDYAAALGEFGRIVPVGEHAALAAATRLKTQSVASLA
jgi:peptidoglycan/xylan/chitin deacetylase (PgdA/CDA1 family)